MWNFDSAGLPATMEETTGDSESNVENRGTDSTAEGTGKTLCNGHDKSSGSAVNAEKNQKVITSLCNNNVNLQTSPTSTVNSNLVNTSGTEQHTSPAASLTSGGTGGSQDTRKPDPVFEISLDLQVKIADLGNACWVVSSRNVHYEYRAKDVCGTGLNDDAYIFRLIILRKIFKQGNIEV